jgi:Ca2+-binding EF-hand superfamily protein
VSRRLVLALAGLAFACASAQACAQAAAAKPQSQSQPQPQRALPVQATAPAAPAAPREPAVDATFKAWDADHNGALSQAEFRQGWNSVRQRAEDKVEASLRTQFDKVDANHNGGIDAGEYGKLLLVQRAGKSAPALASFDRNGDQRLEFDEYMALVGRLAVAPRKPQGKSP